MTARLCSVFAAGNSMGYKMRMAAELGFISCWVLASRATFSHYITLTSVLGNDALLYSVHLLHENRAHRYTH